MRTGKCPLREARIVASLISHDTNWPCAFSAGIDDSPNKHQTADQEDRSDPPVELGGHPGQVATQGVGMLFFAELELQQSAPAFLLMQPITCVYAFAAIDAAVVDFHISRVDAGDA